MNRFFIHILLVLLLSINYSICIYANENKVKEIIFTVEDPIMKIDGVKTEIDPGRGTCPFIHNSRTMIPIRVLIESLGGNVKWDGAQKSVIISLNDIRIQLWIDKNYIVVNNIKKEMDVYPLIKNSRTMVPLRFILENLNYKVEWIENIKKVIIKTSFDKLELFNKIKSKYNCSQLIYVEKEKTTRSSLTAYEFNNKVWNDVKKSEPCYIGKNGFSLDKSEGDKKTPAGIFLLGFAFGIGSDIDTKLEYRKTNGNQYWVDDPKSVLYNTWQEGSVNERWKSAENLYISAYNYAVVIEYNTKDRIPYKGSAIFLHVTSNKPTLGCISVNEEVLKSIINWLDPNKNPVIIMGNRKMIEKF
ncbi:MAG: stalk domain-containing protein [Clostridiales bacterium]